MKLNKKYSGFTLTEILLVLVIAAAIVISAFIIYPKVRTSMNVNNEAQYVSLIATGIRGIYQGKSDYSDLTADLVIKSKIVPENMIDQGVIINNNYKGKVAVSSVSSNGIASVMQIKTTNIPQSDCFRLAHRLYQDNQVNLKDMYVNSTLVYIQDDYMPYDIAKTQQACSKNDITDITLDYVR